MTKPLTRKEMELAHPTNPTYWIDETIRSIKRSRSFDMGDWCHCIAYHVCKVTGEQFRIAADDRFPIDLGSGLLHMEQVRTLVKMVALYFKLEYTDAMRLCMPAGYYGKATAIRVLTKLRDTGEVAWPDEYRFDDEFRRVMRETFPIEMINGYRLTVIERV